jgi:ADP-heptose:LPS heptosyltransferase
LENTSADLARELLAHCMEGTHWPEALIDRLIEDDASRALFSIVVERLSDLFEPRLCDVYADLFSEVIGKALPDDLHAPHLAARYRRVRRPRKMAEPHARNVFVLSRVTLGADVAVTSVVLDGAKRAFPNAEIYFAGSQKGWELFAGDDRVQHLPVQYGRGGSVRDRLSIWPELREAVCRRRSIVIDPDSRLSQLGLLPLCREEDYYFFESRSYMPESPESLVRLTQRWVAETFGVHDAKPYIEPMPLTTTLPRFATTVSFGVGENAAKRLPDPFETELLKRLPRPLLIDKGAGGEEAERVERAIADCGGGVQVWDGSFAGFASHIQRSRLFVGYDSAGGHVAAACGVPLVGIFAGYPSERMFDRWRPSGDGPIRVVKVVRDTNPLAEALRAVDALTRA